MKPKRGLRGIGNSTMSVAIICLTVFTACSNGAGDNVVSKGTNANVGVGNDRSAAAVSTPVPSASAASTQAVQPGTKTPDSDKSRVASPKPQIGSGGNDFFQFTQARAAISVDPELKTANIVIDVKAGVVTLSGRVASAAQKSKAEQVVRAVGGVKEVNNRLQISN